MADITFYSGSAEYISATVDSSADPTGGTVEFNFTTDENDPTSGWVAGAWDGSATLKQTGTSAEHYETSARILVGVGTSWVLVGDVGYVGWVKVTSGSEAVVRRFVTIRTT